MSYSDGALVRPYRVRQESKQQLNDKLFERLGAAKRGRDGLARQRSGGKRKVR